MSDALTDIARDERRGRLASSYLDCLLAYLKKPTKKNLLVLHDAAKSVDAVRGGYWGSQTDINSGLDAILEQLMANDKKAWMRILRYAEGEAAYNGLKGLSPFAGKALLVVNYGSGFVTIKGDITDAIENILRTRDMCVYDCDKYVVALDLNKDVDIEWIGCGIRGIKSPYKKDRER